VRKATAASALRAMRSMGGHARAKALLRFFKTGPGQYGEGDKFLGLTVPQIRRLVGDYRGLSLPEIEKLLESSWHEARTLAVALLAARYPKASPAEKTAIYRLYLERTDRVNNWDLVDISAPAVVGGHLLERSRAPLRRLARSNSVWERRIAMVATLAFIREGQFDDTLRLARMLSDDRHDLIHKATGWMLREVGKRDERVLRRFLDVQGSRLPRTALRYSIERLSPTMRKRYMALPARPRAPRR
jgi:3-methyladenine DNA glycosylase AlkD